MTENIEPQNNNTSLWKRAFGFIQAMEEASEYSPAERAVIDLNKRVSEVEGTIRNLENKRTEQSQTAGSSTLNRKRNPCNFMGFPF